MSNKQRKLELVEPARERLMDNTHCDQLSDMKSRIYALHLAICGVQHDLLDSSAGPALIQLSMDIAEQMDAIYEAFTAEFKLRRVEKGLA
ncbi:hypothetical protein IYW40_09220 [Methylocystis sp. H4A]|uniref:hypothetical protein n=1 Tax=Methylocystis sp. H4A TaxID=2785788 RepID=UPI0018C2A1BB|nr:hypothetical protein [Methylocystis sp. H4A]MBG0801664.1 hypothetical protein [Methylocystis sp. H4A]